MKKTALLVALSLISLSFFARASGPTFDHSTLLVEDTEVSATFYRNILKLEELETPWGDDPSIRFFSMGGNLQLHIAHGDTSKLSLNKTIHLAFSVADFDEYLGFLRDHGIAFSTFDGEPDTAQERPDGVQQIYFQDPDGYWIEINDATY